jgi:hypothetical protein
MLDPNACPNPKLQYLGNSMLCNPFDFIIQKLVLYHLGLFSGILSTKCNTYI